MTTIIRSITNCWSKSGIIDKSDSDVYGYGLELLLYSVVNMVAILLTALLVGKMPESVALIFAITPLQAFGGGYHAKTHLRCFLIMYIGWWAVIFVLPFFGNAAATVAICLSVVVVYLVAPVSHVNVKMSVGQQLKMRRLVRIAALVIALLSSVLIWFTDDVLSIGASLSAGLFVAALSIGLAHCKNKFQAKVSK